MRLELVDADLAPELTVFAKV